MYITSSNIYKRNQNLIYRDEFSFVKIRIIRIITIH